ncbi:MAG: tyrosine phosphatase family protein [Alphaproteobacteria bacterium]
MEVHVCPLNVVETAITTHAPSHLISLLSGETMIDTPAGIVPQNHLKVALNDIAAPEPGLVEPSRAHAQAIIDFAGGWDQAAPMLIHCYAGISRSTAAALIVLCTLEAPGGEAALAGRLRAAAPFARPNPLLVACADAVLGRQGELTQALGTMGEAELAWQGALFRLAVP